MSICYWVYHTITYIHGAPWWLYFSSTPRSKLGKALYGLKQAPKTWYGKIADYLQFCGYFASNSNSSLFVKRQSKVHVIVLLYVMTWLLLATMMKKLQSYELNFNSVWDERFEELSHLLTPYELTCFSQTLSIVQNLTLVYWTLISFHFPPSVRIFYKILTEMCEITKIPLVIFLIFLFNLTAIFNGSRYLNQNESLIPKSPKYTKISISQLTWRSSILLVCSCVYWCKWRPWLIGIWTLPSNFPHLSEPTSNFSY